MGVGYQRGIFHKSQCKVKKVLIPKVGRDPGCQDTGSFNLAVPSRCETLGIAEWSVPRVLWAEASHAARCPIMHGTPATPDRCLQQNAGSAGPVKPGRNLQVTRLSPVAKVRWYMWAGAGMQSWDHRPGAWCFPVEPWWSESSAFAGFMESYSESLLRPFLLGKLQFCFEMPSFPDSGPADRIRLTDLASTNAACPVRFDFQRRKMQWEWGKGAWACQVLGTVSLCECGTDISV